MVRFFTCTCTLLLSLYLVARISLPASAAPPSGDGQSHQIRILFISSCEKQYTVQDQLEKGLELGLKKDHRQHEFFYEFMYASRIRDKGFHDIYAAYLDKKFRGVPLDFIVAWADDASIFLNRYPDLFPDARRIYLQKPGTLQLVPQNLHAVIGVRTDFKKSVAEMLAIQNPDRLLVIGSTENSVAAGRLAAIKTALAELAPAIAIEYLVDLPLETVRARLSATPENNTAAFFVLMFSDGQGVSLSPYEVAESLAQSSRIPIYTYLENLLGSGVVGGYVISQTAEGQFLGELLGNPDAALREIDLTPMRYIFDWAALDRWQVDQTRLPSAALIINRPPKLLKEYYPHLIAGIVFITIQMAMIIYLFVNRNRLHKAKSELVQHRDHLEQLVSERTAALSQSNQEIAERENRFRSLSDATVEGIVFIAGGKIIEVNRSMARMVDRSVAEITGRDVLAFVDPVQRDLVSERIRNNYTDPYETLLVDKNGTSFPVSIQGRSFTYKGQRVRVAVVRDLRELKEAQEEILTLQGILPICASCKKIRDDQGYWNKLEEYIQKHSDALFSHGLCHDCAEQLYGDQPWFKEIPESERKDS